MLRAVSTCLAFTILATGCARDNDPTPEDYLGVDQADLSAATLPGEVDQAGGVPLADTELAAPEAARFAADATLADDGDATTLVEEGSAAEVARSRREVLVAVRWGYFPARPADTWTDWSGFVAISRGEVELVRPLRFENDHDGTPRPHEDFVRPDHDPRLVRFRSHTRPAWDGLLLRVRRPKLGPAVLVIHAGAVTRVLAFEELYHLDASETVDAAGHELKIRARAVPRLDPPCIDEVALAHGDFSAGNVSGTVDAAAGPVAMIGRTLDLRGPYGLVAVELRDVDSGAQVGAARGIYASFHYSAGGVLAARVRDGADDLRGVLAGSFAGDGSFAARVLQRCQ